MTNTKQKAEIILELPKEENGIDPKELLTLAPVVASAYLEAVELLTRTAIGIHRFMANNQTILGGKTREEISQEMLDRIDDFLKTHGGEDAL